MAFLDEITIHVSAGKGGNGVVRWRREKFIPKGGPSGGNGGRGGDVFVKAVKSLRILDQYRQKRDYKAQNGEDGGSRNLHGASGEDLYLEFPIGSKITNIENGISFELTKEGQIEKILKGGQGGLGNEHFKSSTNQTPQQSTPGKDGEESDFSIEVSLIADIGLIGFPNAGKSSLLNAITNAQAKVGDYAFTTLDPNLGDMYGYIVADIPGLIEGASEGKGLGHKFLKHIKKTKVLIHLVSFENKDMVVSYEAVRDELGRFDKSLLDKPEIILLTKTDVADKNRVEDELKKFKKLKKPVFAVTLFDDRIIKNFRDEIVIILNKIKPLSL